KSHKLCLFDVFSSVEQIINDKFNNIDIVEYTRTLDFLTAVSHKLGNSIFYKALSETSFSLK
ncbi:S49 family peptidase, partial [Francisella tularensis subsp. holarctica]|nr:S49 family peptidase [Francisella tularensis subsp. holarctica]